MRQIKLSRHRQHVKEERQKLHLEVGVAYPAATSRGRQETLSLEADSLIKWFYFTLGGSFLVAQKALGAFAESAYGKSLNRGHLLGGWRGASSAVVLQQPPHLSSDAL